MTAGAWRSVRACVGFGLSWSGGWVAEIYVYSKLGVGLRGSVRSRLFCGVRVG